jgi:lipid-binding SYLF domain-containing protein
MNNQGKFGADAGLTVGLIGYGVEGATTTNFGADVLVFAYSFVGLYGGISLEGSALVRRNDLNVGYYGEGATPQAILVDRTFTNPQAAGLKADLGGG